MKMIFDDIQTLVETFHGTSLHLNSYLVSATPLFLYMTETPIQKPNIPQIPTFTSIPAERLHRQQRLGGS
jgi:hypothetical protein